MACFNYVYCRRFFNIFLMKITYIKSILTIIANNDFVVDASMFDELHGLTLPELASRYKRVYYAFHR